MRYRYLLLLFAFIFSACEKGAAPVENNSQSDTPSNNIRNYLTRVAREMTTNSLTYIHDLDDWKNVRADRLKEFISMVSLEDMPLQGNRPPLNVTITGEIQMEGYRIIKLYYESLPDLYVPAHLYMPDNISEPRAAVLYLCGHSHTQMVHYQPHARKFARLGFVCLIVETIQYGEVWGEHWGEYARGWFNWYSRGYTPAGVEIWNAIRGLDLLSERPEVDPEKLGVTGISGGGAMSWFLAAVDPRVKAAAPVCGASTIQAQIICRTIDGHCDCMYPVNTGGWDIPEIGALIAPRALLIAQANRDGLNQIESVRDIYHKLKQFYGFYGKPENVDFIETPGGHSYHQTSREKIFSFFFKHLMGKDVTPEEAGDVNETPEAQLSEEQLKVFINGPPENNRTKFIQDSFVKLPLPPDITNEAELSAYRGKVKNFLTENTFHAFPVNPPEYDSALVFRTLDGAAYGYKEYSFNSEKDWRLKVKLYYRNPPDEKKPLIIFLQNADEKKNETEVFSYGVPDDRNVAILEVRGVEEFGWSPELQWHVRRASAWTGRTIASMQVFDVLRALDFCRTLPGVDPDQVGLAGRNDKAVVALYSALMDGNCKTVIIKNPPPTQDQGSSPDGRGPAIEMLNCLRITDVNQIPALLYPAEVICVGDLPVTFNWSENTLKKLGSGTMRKVGSLDEL